MQFSTHLLKLARRPCNYRGSLVLASRSLSASSAFSNAQSQGTKVIQPTLGVAAAMKAQSDSRFQPKVQIFQEFALKDGVAVVTGGNGGLGLEMAMALAEAGATLYCIDLPDTPSPEFNACAAYAEKLGTSFNYVKADVTSQAQMSSVISKIAQQHGRIDACVAAAGILGPTETSALDLSEDDFRKVQNVNTTGVFLTAQAALNGMVKTGSKGSIILIASMSGSIVNRGHPWVAYNTSKSAVLQMARNLACEFGKDGIRVNTISPGHIYTKQTAAVLDLHPEQGKIWANSNPLGRMGQVHELRGVVTWLASSASSFCTGSDILVSGGHHAW
ncbi:hypothetical protein NliqN6_3996 [Naganishia liquefaciens]|uniref:SDR family oxidoreductase n=1 Tax=Naganishia liquefaciens TaxID=104408 RepID=A0A8H3YFG2_9TREE|nr:hypothetical protein NliqN6_3996 [Naganishia liquefaciens]